jgi:hypothetical protein
MTLFGLSYFYFLNIIFLSKQICHTNQHTIFFSQNKSVVQISQVSNWMVFLQESQSVIGTNIFTTWFNALMCTRLCVKSKFLKSMVRFTYLISWTKARCLPHLLSRRPIQYSCDTAQSECNKNIYRRPGGDALASRSRTLRWLFQTCCLFCRLLDKDKKTKLYARFPPLTCGCLNNDTSVVLDIFTSYFFVMLLF